MAEIKAHDVDPNDDPYCDMCGHSVDDVGSVWIEIPDYEDGLTLCARHLAQLLVKASG